LNEVSVGFRLAFFRGFAFFYDFVRLKLGSFFFGAKFLIHPIDAAFTIVDLVNDFRRRFFGDILPK